MPPGWGEVLTTAVNLGGLGIGLAVTIIVIVALVRGDLVPGYVYRREVKRADGATQDLKNERAKDEAATAAAAIAEHAAEAVLRAQHAGHSAAGHADEPR